MDTRAEWDTTGCVPKGKDGARPKRYNLKVKIDVGFMGAPELVPAEIQGAVKIDIFPVTMGGL